MKHPRISVVMPAYNSEKYIGEAIESILNQTFTDFELLVLNDSPNNKELEKIVKDYAKKDKRVKYMKNPKNLGVTESRNKLLKACTGEFIACMDSDDISMPTRFQKQIEYMEKHPECGVLGTGYKLFGTEEYTKKFPEKITILRLLQGCTIANPSVLMRKSVLDKNNITYDNNYNWCEDYEFWSRVVFFTEIHNLDDILLKYRWHGENISVEHAKKQKELADQVKQNILNRLTDDIQQQRLLLGKLKPGFLLPKFIGRIICLFIFNHKTRHKFRDQYVKD